MMTYVGDFPPCTHKFVVSSGVVICERCGNYPVSQATIQTTSSGSVLPSRITRRNAV